MNRDMIERYARGAGGPRRAIEGLSREELLAVPVPGRWSIHQLVLHLFDSDQVGSDRMKRVAAMDKPLLMGYDENAYIRSLAYERLDPVLACELFEKNRLMTAAMLRALPDAAFERVGIHSERGIERLADLVKGYGDHLEHHLKFLREKRRALGKPL